MLLVLLADLRNLATLDRDLDRYTLVGGASIYPFAWSLLLAAHDAGLGGVITTVAIRQEPALRRLFGIPEPVVVAGVLALGYPAGSARPSCGATRWSRSPPSTATTAPRSRPAIRRRISPWTMANHPSGEALQAAHAALDRLEVVTRRQATVDRLVGERRCDHPVGPHPAPPLPVVRCGEAPHRRGGGDTSRSRRREPTRAGAGRHRARRRCSGRRRGTARATASAAGPRATT